MFGIHLIWLFSIDVQVVGDAKDSFDGITTVNFEAVSLQENETVTEDLHASSNVTFFHCREGNVWGEHASNNQLKLNCQICAELVIGDVEVCHCLLLSMLSINPSYTVCSL